MNDVATFAALCTAYKAVQRVLSAVETLFCCAVLLHPAPHTMHDSNHCVHAEAEYIYSFSSSDACIMNDNTVGVQHVVLYCYVGFILSYLFFLLFFYVLQDGVTVHKTKREAQNILISLSSVHN